MCATVAWQYGGGVQGADRHRAVIPGDTQMSLPRVQVPPPLKHVQLRPEGRNSRGETRLRGSEVLGPLRGLGIRPLVSAIRGLGNPFPEAP